MYKTTVKIEGMMCGGCEKRVNEVVDRNIKVKSVTSSHKDGQTVIVSRQALDEAAVREIIEKTGFKVLSVVTSKESLI